MEGVDQGRGMIDGERGSREMDDRLRGRIEGEGGLR